MTGINLRGFKRLTETNPVVRLNTRMTMDFTREKESRLNMATVEKLLEHTSVVNCVGHRLYQINNIGGSVKPQFTYQ